MNMQFICMVPSIITILCPKDSVPLLLAGKLKRPKIKVKLTSNRGDCAIPVDYRASYKPVLVK